MNTTLSRKTLLVLTLSTLILAVGSLAWMAGNRSPARADSRVQAEIWSVLEAEGEADVLLLLDDAPAPDLSPAYRLSSKEERGRWVYETLTAHARRSQTRLVAQLQREGIAFRQFWTVNAVQAEVNSATLKRALALPEVKQIISNAAYQVTMPEPAAELAAAGVSAIAWGVQRVDAPWAWAQGYTGAGVVVGGQDTGYAWDHPALRRSFRGFDPTTELVDFNYSWHDAIHKDILPSDVNPCGYNSPVPCDDHSHGTHTMGTMVGNDLDPIDPTWPAGAPNAIGVAPGAKWIGCRNMDNGVGQPGTYIECFEWLTAPYPIGGDPLTEGDPDRAPDVINNSWGCPPKEGCYPEIANIIEPALDAADAAGIMVVTSAGNSGPFCSTVVDPPAIYRNAFTVGATDDRNNLANFSSRGPLTIANQEVIKPDVVGPGVSVRSSIIGDHYSNFSGTSMAAPHTVGIIALLLQAEPALRGQTELIKSIMRSTTTPITDFLCGGDASGSPNNRFGSGLINARRALESLSQNGHIAGIVTDERTGAPLAGVTITAFDVSGTAVATAKSNGLGSYGLETPWGVYRVQAERADFTTLQMEPVYVVGGHTTQQPLALSAQRTFLPILRR